MFSLQDGGGGGYEGKKKNVYQKQASHFGAVCSKFHFSREAKFFGVQWVGGLAWAGESARSPPPPPLWIGTSLPPMPIVVHKLCFVVFL